MSACDRISADRGVVAPREFAEGCVVPQARARKFPEVAARPWGGHLWSPSYFVAWCGGVTVETVQAYIEGQRRPE